MPRLLALFALLLTLTAPLPLAAAEVRVFAAASLTEALRAAVTLYERQSGDRVVFNFAGSSTLARQIEAGAPADLFLSADEAKMDDLARRGLLVAATRTSVLSNTLVVVVPIEGGRSIPTVRALTSVRSLALAEPSRVPAGIYARQYLMSAGLWDQLVSKVIPTENVRAALAAVASGNADAAIVYRTDALSSKRVRVAFAVPRAAGPAISYPFALLRDAEQPRAARRLLAFLRSKPALDIFARYGFLIR
jgi:molybdate transport system substrate-binding protein